MIRRIWIENFKGIGSRVEIPIRPITLLFGANSSGKSTIFHALQLANEVFAHRSLNVHETELGGDYVDLGGFSNFVHNHEDHREILLGFELNLEERPLPDYSSPLPAGLLVEPPDSLVGEYRSAAVEITVAWSNAQSRPFVKAYSVSIDGRQFASIEHRTGVDECVLSFDALHSSLRPAHQVDWVWPGGLVPDDAGITDYSGLFAAWVQLREANREIAVARDLPPGQFATLVHLPAGALPKWGEALRLLYSSGTERDSMEREQELSTIESLTDALSQLIVGPGELVQRWLSDVRFLGPLREIPERGFTAVSSAPKGRWASGLAAWDLLLSGKYELVQETAAWLGDSNKLNSGYFVERDFLRYVDDTMYESLIAAASLAGERDPDEVVNMVESVIEGCRKGHRLVIVNGDTRLETEPADVGVGISQLVPVVVASLSPLSSATLIEQPELHLHPAIQVGLGDLFIARVHAAEGPVVLETHSEHLVLRLLRRIREESEGNLPDGALPLSPHDLAVVCLERLGGEVVAHTLEVNATGEFVTRWPKGFFDERAEELF